MCVNKPFPFPRWNFQSFLNHVATQPPRYPVNHFHHFQRSLSLSTRRFVISHPSTHLYESWPTPTPAPARRRPRPRTITCPKRAPRRGSSTTWSRSFGPELPYVNDKSSNPLMSGARVVLAAFFMESMKWARSTAWRKAGFGNLTEPQLGYAPGRPTPCSPGNH